MSIFLILWIAIYNAASN